MTRWLAVFLKSIFPTVIFIAARYSRILCLTLFLTPYFDKNHSILYQTFYLPIYQQKKNFCSSQTFFVSRIATPRLYSAAFSLVILTDIPLNLVSCTQQISTDLCSSISKISPNSPLKTPTLTLQTWRSTSLLSGWCSHWMVAWLGLHVALVLMCAASWLWKVPISFVQFSLSIIFVIS